jgi:mono/diheme cytochrome c family protein
MNERRYLIGTIMLLAGCLANPIATAQSISTQALEHAVPLRIPSPQPVAAPVEANRPPIDALLKWDAMTKEVTVTNGTAQANFVFNLTNVSSAQVIISNAHASCGCTVAQLPQQPWFLAPGTNSELRVTMNLAGKFGEVTKTITITTDSGIQMLFVKSKILPAPAAQMGDREANQKLALADRQAVFKGDCAVCHTEPAKGKMGLALYAAACSVCHEAPHRASMVPDLRAIKQETNAEFWRNWITHGKAGTLMPAFSEKENGILSDAQIESLVSYLTNALPSKPQAQAAKPVDKAL